jgi:hypothetical protein
MLTFSYIDFNLDVMVINDIIEQAAGRGSKASDRGGTIYSCVLQFL